MKKIQGNKPRASHMKSHEDMQKLNREKEAKNLAVLHKQCRTCVHWKPFGTSTSDTQKCCHYIMDTDHCRVKTSPQECGSWEPADPEDKRKPRKE